MSERKPLWATVLVLSLLALLGGGFFFNLFSGWGVVGIIAAVAGVVLFPLSAFMLRRSRGTLWLAVFIGAGTLVVSGLCAGSVWLSAFGERRDCELTRAPSTDPDRKYDYAMMCGGEQIRYVLKTDSKLDRKLPDPGPRQLVVDRTGTLEAFSADNVSTVRNVVMGGAAFGGLLFVVLVISLPRRRQVG